MLTKQLICPIYLILWDQLQNYDLVIATVQQFFIGCGMIKTWVFFLFYTLVSRKATIHFRRKAFPETMTKAFFRNCLQVSDKLSYKNRLEEKCVQIVFFYYYILFSFKQTWILIVCPVFSATKNGWTHPNLIFVTYYSYFFNNRQLVSFIYQVLYLPNKMYILKILNWCFMNFGNIITCET